MPSTTYVRRAVAVVGGFLLGAGVSSYVEATKGNTYSGLLLAGLGVGLLAAALIRE